jgi:hypothetical protein
MDMTANPISCDRCDKDQAIIHWSGFYGAPEGAYCPLCWEISMSAWVLTQYFRESALKLVDTTIADYREKYGYKI